MMNDERLLEVLDDENSEDSTTSYYLKQIESSLYDDVRSRKAIDEILLFGVSQISSTSVAWLLCFAQSPISIVITLAGIVSLSPGLIDAGDGFRFEASSERWEIHHKSPIKSLVKLSVGLVFSWNSTTRIASETWKTEAEIRSVYTDIKENSRSESFLLSAPDLLPILIALVLGLTVLALRNKNAKSSQNN